MHLNRLRIGHFWRDRELEIELTAPNGKGPGLGFFVGPNGAGKSRVLEALGRIFSHLDAGASPGLDFDLEYELAGRRVLITTSQPQLEGLDEGEDYRLDGRGVWLLTAPTPFITWRKDHLEATWPSDSDTVLPRWVIGLSTGPNSRLSWALNGAVTETLTQQLVPSTEDAFPPDLPPKEWQDYRRREQKELSDEVKRSTERPRCVALSGTELLIGILALLSHPQAGEPRYAFRDELFRRVHLDASNGLLAFSVDVASDWRDSIQPSELGLFERLLDQATRRLTLAFQASESPDLDAPRQRAVFEMTPAFTEWLAGFADTPLIWFYRLLAWLRMGVVDSVHLLLAKTDGAGLVLDDDFSDGEFLLVGRYGLLLLLRGEGDCLILFDEPETHFNDRWKVELVADLIQVLTDEDSHAHVLLATHSDLTLTDADQSGVRILDPDAPDGATVRPPTVSPFAADREEITLHVFGAERSMGRHASQVVDEALKQSDIGELTKTLARVGPGFHRFRLQYAIQDEYGDDAP